MSEENKTGIPSIKLTRRIPETAAAISKSQRSRFNNSSYDAYGNRDISPYVNPMLFNQVLNKRAKRNSDTAAILKLLPDIQLSKQILVSCILSPKDMTSTDLIFTAPKDIFSPDLSSSLISRLKTYFEEEYDIKPQLTKILEDALFDKGSYPIAVLPENVIDEFINGNRVISTESYGLINKEIGKRSVGILGKSVDSDASKTDRLFSIESYTSSKDIQFSDDNGSYLTVSQEDLKISDTSANDKYGKIKEVIITDNIFTLKTPYIAKELDKQAIKSSISNNSAISLESNSKLNDVKIEKLIFRNRSQRSKQIDELKTQDNLSRKSVGRPLIMNLPSESIIPIHVTGNKSDHVGYFLLLDGNGYPIDANDGDHDFQSMTSNTSNSLASSLIKRVETNMGQTNCWERNQEFISHAVRIYGDIIEKDLIARVRNGIYKSNVSIGKNEEIYRVMLARTLEKKMTQVLYIPTEYITYIAFDYDDSGIGKSLMDDTMTVNTLRVILMFTDMIGSIKNSIGRTKVQLDIPPKDMAPEKTIERVVDEVIRSRTVQLPTNVSNPTDVFEFIQRAGYEWEFTGHPKLPELKLMFDQIQSNYQAVDSTLQDNLKKASISALGLTPELVDNGFANSEFASVAMANNVLLSKRILNMQEIFVPQLTDHLRKVAMFSQNLVDDLKSILENNFEGIKIELDSEYGEEVLSSITEDVKKRLIVTKALSDLLTGFFADLPKPTSVTLEQQMSDLDTYTEGLDKALDGYISDKIMTDSIVGDLAADIGPIREIIKAYYIRKFLSEKGIMSELSELTSTDEEGKPMFDLVEIIRSHLDSLKESGLNALVTLASSVKESNDKLNKAREEPEPDSEVVDEGTDETKTSSDDDTDEFTSIGDDDLNI